MSYRMINVACFAAVLVAFSAVESVAQRAQKMNRGPEVPDHPQAVGEAGIAWYTTWKSGLAEAKRTNRPIFFMSAATTCSGVSGVF